MSAASDLREYRARITREVGMDPCSECGLPAEPATWYCGRCWATVMTRREIIKKELGVA
jgi:lipopolysaccharide biosynthesis regulator YciM